MPEEEVIGWLVSSPNDRGICMVGKCCEPLLSDFAKDTLSKVYLVNIVPYKQDCCLCGEVLVDSPTWPILYERKPITREAASCPSLCK
jgi:hypothetical protein